MTDSINPGRRQQKFDAYHDFDHQAGTDIRRTQPVRYGDNAMLDEFADTFALDRLNTILNNAGIKDEDIVAGARFSRSGYQKIAGKMKLRDPKEAETMLNMLVSKLRKEQRRVEESYRGMLGEDDRRFSYEKDWLQNVTIRDAESGEEVSVEGAEGAQLLSRLEEHPEEEQQILANYMIQRPLRESEDLDEDDSYDDEIKAKSGSYNFPWQGFGGRGIATAFYTGDKLKVKIVSVRNENDEEVPIDDEHRAMLTKQALDFIAKC